MSKIFVVFLALMFSMQKSSALLTLPHEISRKLHMALGDLVIALTGASGSRYGLRLIEVCLRAGRTVHLVISPAATEVLATEVDRKVSLDEKTFDPKALLGELPEEVDWGLLKYHHFRNFQAGIASGSFLTSGMAVCPCSMGTVAAIAHGISENLIHRAADVHLKERRKLVLVPRETPLGLIQLKNLTAAAEAGAVILPAMPAYYTKPQSIDDMVDFIVARVADQLGVPHNLLKRWSESSGLLRDPFLGV
jgi:flavin prenyltransferase